MNSIKILLAAIAVLFALSACNKEEAASAPEQVVEEVMVEEAMDDDAPAEEAMDDDAPAEEAMDEEEAE